MFLSFLETSPLLCGIAGVMTSKYFRVSNLELNKRHSPKLFFMFSSALCLFTFLSLGQVVGDGLQGNLKGFQVKVC